MTSGLPTGVVTLLFTDIEGSTRLFHELGDRHVEVLDEHHARMRAAIEDHRGVEVRTEGDALFVAFADPADGLAACLAAQRALASGGWPHEAEIRAWVRDSPRWSAPSASPAIPTTPRRCPT